MQLGDMLECLLSAIRFSIATRQVEMMLRWSAFILAASKGKRWAHAKKMSCLSVFSVMTSHRSNTLTLVKI